MKIQTLERKQNKGNRVNHGKTAGQFKPGHDPRRNLAGQKSANQVEAGRRLVDALIREGDQVQKDIDWVIGKGDIVGLNNFDALARTIWRRAIDGEIHFVNIVLDRLAGKVAAGPAVEINAETFKVDSIAGQTKSENSDTLDAN